MKLPYTYKDEVYQSVLPKYLINEEEKTLEQVLTRCSYGNQEFLNGFSNGLMPQGSILYGANNPNNCSLSNCYFLGIQQDSIEGIMETAGRAATTYKFRGGVGIDLSKLRPRGSKVSNSAKTSTGAASFAELYSCVTLTIGQQGRRGALMLTINGNHPDVEEFILMKQDLGKIEGANVSVKIDDNFMESVKIDSLYELSFNNEIYRTVRAKELFNTLATCAYKRAEPGVIFWDRVREYGPAAYYIEPEGTNPCSEIPMPHGDACTLASIYLPHFVIDPYVNPRFNWQLFEEVIRTGINYLDFIKDKDNCPFDFQKEIARKYRRIGLGMHGLGDCLIRLNITYGSEEALKFCSELSRFLKDKSYSQSARLAKEFGTFDGYSPDIEKLCPWVEHGLSINTIEELKKYGRRNIQCNTVAPTGSISILCNNCTSGCEPIFRLSYNRTLRVSGKDEIKPVYHPEVLNYCNITGNTPNNLPNHFISSEKINPSDRVRMQAKLTEFIDHSISSTVNLPKGSTVEDVKNIFMLAYELRCKGITVYVDGSREGILNPVNDSIKLNNVSNIPDILPAYRFKVSSNQVNWYVTITIKDGKPFDVIATNNYRKDDFVEDANLELMHLCIKYKLRTEYKNQVSKSSNNVELFARLVSLLLRSNIKISEIFECVNVPVGSVPYWIKKYLIDVTNPNFDPNCPKGNC